MQVTADRHDVAKFESFFLTEHPKLIALGLGWTGNRETAAELAQETLTRAFRTWSTIQHLDVPGAWVRRVMINLLIDDRRGSVRHQHLIDRLDRPGTGPEPDLIDGRWWSAVRALPDRERAAVTLHYVEDLPINEVASILEIAPGTVKATLSHARAKLRDVLQEGND